VLGGDHKSYDPVRSKAVGDIHDPHVGLWIPEQATHLSLRSARGIRMKLIRSLRELNASRHILQAGLPDGYVQVERFDKVC
jgi:hypothetical protein